MPAPYAGLSPREILDQAAAQARDAENSILEALGLDQTAEEMKRLQDQETAAAKRQARATSERRQLRTQLHELRTNQDHLLKSALDAGVSVARLVEVTGRDRATISRIKNAEVSVDGDGDQG